jgi:hypothetical protein
MTIVRCAIVSSRPVGKASTMWTTSTTYSGPM